MNPPPSIPERGRRLFLPIVWIFGGISLLFFLTVGVIVYLAVTQGTGEFRSGILIPLCGVPLLFASMLYAAIRYIFHRFGQPMAAIYGVYDPTPETLGDTLDETRLLARLVADLQTLSLVENGQLPLHPTRFCLADLLDDVAASFASRAAELGVDLQAESAPGLELTADYDRLDQALSNLVANALRYTPRGGTIRLRAAAAGTQAGNATRSAPSVRLTIQDTGAGIPAEDLPFIFDRFWRRDKSRARSAHPHSGLGLAITRQLILAHSGTIAVESTVGQGTTFTIELPPPADRSIL